MSTWHDPYCECGRAKPKPTSKQCVQCRYLDEGTPPSDPPSHNHGLRSLIVSTLRGTDGLSTREIMMALGRSTKDQYLGILRCLHTLLRNKRVRRYWREDAVNNTYRQKVSQNYYASCWVYTLSGALR